MRFRSVLAALLAAFVLLPHAAKAQIGASLTIESQYRLRSFAPSNRKPSASLNLSYDHKSGFYAGGSAIVFDASKGRVSQLGFMEYAGFVKPLKHGPALDVGVFNTDLTRYTDARATPLKYTEVYAGATSRNVSLHAYYSPNYLRGGSHTVYLDVSGAVRPRDKWRLFARGGALIPVNDQARAGLLRTRYDVRAGVARELGPAELNLSWTYSWPPFTRPGQSTPPQGAWVLGATYFF